MEQLTQRLAQLSSAEEFLDFFGIPYEQHVLNVSRLHILKRFYQYLRREANLGSSEDEVSLYIHYRSLLVRSYEDFVRSTPSQEKVFKVFQDAEGKQTVSISRVRATLSSQA